MNEEAGLNKIWVLDQYTGLIRASIFTATVPEAAKWFYRTSVALLFNGARKVKLSPIGKLILENDLSSFRGEL